MECPGATGTILGMASQPPLQEGELVPGMEIVAVHNQAIRTPRRLRIDSFPRLTNNDGLHLQATDLETGEPWVIRHSSIYIPSKESEGIPPDWCAYPLADADLSKVGGFVPPAVARFDRIGLVDLPALIEDLHGYPVVQAREPLPANSYYAVLRITDVASHIQIALVSGAKSTDHEEAFIPPIVSLYYDQDIGAWGEEVQPDLSVIPVHQYGERISDIAVVIPGVEGIDPDITENDIGRWAKPLTSQQVAERLVHVAEHLEQIADPAVQDSVPEPLRSGRTWQPTPNWGKQRFRPWCGSRYGSEIRRDCARARQPCSSLRGRAASDIGNCNSGAGGCAAGRGVQAGRSCCWRDWSGQSSTAKLHVGPGL